MLILSQILDTDTSLSHYFILFLFFLYTCVEAFFGSGGCYQIFSVSSTFFFLYFYFAPLSCTLGSLKFLDSY